MSNLEPRPIILQPDDLNIRLIALTKGMIATVDTGDYEDLMQHLWVAGRFRNKWYAYRTIRIAGKRTSLLMHRYLLGLSPGDDVLVDHENGDGLDCRRKNLRSGDDAQNGQNRGMQANNTSGFKGVTPYRYNPDLWVAQIKSFGKAKHIGIFREKEKAALAYDLEAVRLHGKFAKLNFPQLPF